MTSPPPPAGWYDDPDANDQLRYWDGGDWTEHTAPNAAPPPPTGTAVQLGAECPYCHSGIHPDASRCPSCSGELKFCSSCREHVGVTSKQKFVGMARGGMKTQYRCMKCGRVVDGPRF